MNVIRAEVLGMCFGVRDALAGPRRRSTRPEAVTIHGELVHNEAVLTDSQAAASTWSARAARRALPVTRHGADHRPRRQPRGAAAAARRPASTWWIPPARWSTRATRPPRSSRRRAITSSSSAGAATSRCEGIVEDLHSFDVIQGPRRCGAIPPRRLGIMCQTTAPAAARRAHPRRRRRPQSRRRDPLRRHGLPSDQGPSAGPGAAARAGRGDGRRRRPQLQQHPRAGRPLPGEAACRRFTFRTAADLRPGLVHGVETVGLTAGTSTLDATIEEVYQALERMNE